MRRTPTRRPARAWPPFASGFQGSPLALMGPISPSARRRARLRAAGARARNPRRGRGAQAYVRPAAARVVDETRTSRGASRPSASLTERDGVRGKTNRTACRPTRPRARARARRRARRAARGSPRRVVAAAPRTPLPPGWSVAPVIVASGGSGPRSRRATTPTTARALGAALGEHAVGARARRRGDLPRRARRGPAATKVAAVVDDEEARGGAPGEPIQARAGGGRGAPLGGVVDARSSAASTLGNAPRCRTALEARVAPARALREPRATAARKPTPARRPARGPRARGPGEAVGRGRATSGRERSRRRAGRWKRRAREHLGRRRRAPRGGGAAEGEGALGVHPDGAVSPGGARHYTQPRRDAAAEGGRGRSVRGLSRRRYRPYAAMAVLTRRSAKASVTMKFGRRPAPASTASTRGTSWTRGRCPDRVAYGPGRIATRPRRRAWCSPSGASSHARARSKPSAWPPARWERGRAPRATRPAGSGSPGARTAEERGDHGRVGHAGGRGWTARVRRGWLRAIEAICLEGVGGAGRPDTHHVAEVPSPARVRSSRRPGGW